MTRIFVRNIPAQANVEDLKALFAKISPVSEVYVPLPTITTWRRNFAIVTIEGDDSEGKKCVKALNGSVWKGEKLTIEMANEYYKDRIVREKEDEVDQLYMESKRAHEALIVVPLPPVTKDVISLRRNRAQELPNVISMQPSIGDRPNKPKKSKKVVVPCGVKLIFDEDLLLSHGRINYAEDSSDSEDEKDAKTASQKAENKPLLSETGLGAEMAVIVNKLNSGEVKAIGGGLRRGFGSVSIPVSEPKAAAPAPKVIDFTTSKTGRVEVAEHDWRLDEDEQSVEEEVCLTEADLLPEVLEADRQRALAVYNNLPIGPDGLVIVVNKKKLAKEAAAALKHPVAAVEAVSGDGVEADVGGDSTTVATTTSTKTGEKKVNFAATAEVKTIAAVDHVEDDSDIFMFESDIAIEAPPKVLPTTTNTTNGSNTSSKDKEKEKSAVQEIVSEMKAPKQKEQQQQPEPKEKEEKSIKSATDSTTTSNTTEEEDASNIQSTKDGFANMNVLKNIFYKEGGVWWGDDGTLSGAVSKGSAPLDPLFLEAEKHGIDIRTAKKMNSGSGGSSAGGGGLFNFGLDSGASGSGMEVEEEAGEEKQMLFGFFGGDGGSDGMGADVPVNPFLTKTVATTSTAGIDSTTTDTAIDPATTVTASSSTSAEPKGRVSTLVEDTTVASNAVKGKAVEVAFSAAQLVALAKKFSREKSVDALTTEWREGRDRLVLDYKRKRKDMKRRTAAWSNSLPTTSNASSDKPERAQGSGSGSSGGNAGSSGGSVVSRGPQYMRGKRGGANRKRARKA